MNYHSPSHIPSKKETVLPVQPHQLYQAKNINAKITIKSEKKRNTVFAPFAVFIASTKTDAQWLNLLYAVSCIAKCHFPFQIACMLDPLSYYVRNSQDSRNLSVSQVFHHCCRNPVTSMLTQKQRQNSSSEISRLLIYQNAILLSLKVNLHKLNRIQKVSIKVMGSRVNRTESFQYLGVNIGVRAHSDFGGRRPSRKKLRNARKIKKVKLKKRNLVFCFHV